MKKRTKAAWSKHVARKRPVRTRKRANAAPARPAGGQRQDSDDLRRAVEEGMLDLRMKTR